MQGKIIKGIAGFYYVQAENESQYECKAKGIFRKDHKKPLVGDEVTIEVLDEEEKKGSIIELLPRRSELFRPAVANIDQAVIVFACREPEPNFNLLDRFLVLMEKRNVPVILCFTKADLATAEFKKEVQTIYEPAGYPVCFTDYHDFEGEGHKKLFHLLSGKVTAFAGPSGVGKSTLVNHFCPEAGMDTGEVSEKIKRGKHTTRHSEIF
ncbi:MAG: ribosome small subunit-dependent GTPase A, partial [Clostridiales bacterium]|nr:ribosome small subunit-dependent GTPase A [Clostridiales bacterium]